MESKQNKAVALLKLALEKVTNDCIAYVKNNSKTPPLGKTKLDIERKPMCLYEIVSNFFLNIFSNIIESIILNIFELLLKRKWN